MKIYSPSDIANLLGVQVSTLRKYSILLEDAGISFQRNNRNQRWYKDNDVMLLRKFITLKENSDMQLKECAEASYLWSVGNDTTPSSTVSDSVTERHESTEIKELVHNLSDRVDKQSDLLLKQHELIIHLTETIANQSSNQLDAATQSKEIEAPKEDEPVKVNHNKKGFLARLFNK